VFAMLKHTSRTGRPRIVVRKRKGRSLSRSWPGTPRTLSIVSSEVKKFFISSESLEKLIVTSKLYDVCFYNFEIWEKIFAWKLTANEKRFRFRDHFWWNIFEIKLSCKNKFIDFSMLLYKFIHLFLLSIIFSLI